jgi:alpha-galactosidase
MLKKTIPPSGVAATFFDLDFKTGTADWGDRKAFFFFNPSDEPTALSVPISGVFRAKDFWTDEDLGTVEGVLAMPEMPPHSARLIVCEPAGQ